MNRDLADRATRVVDGVPPPPTARFVEDASPNNVGVSVWDGSFHKVTVIALKQVTKGWKKELRRSRNSLPRANNVTQAHDIHRYTLDFELFAFRKCSRYVLKKAKTLLIYNKVF